MRIVYGTILAAAMSAGATLFAAGDVAYDVAAYVWPAYQSEPRWAELGIFADGKGEWQNVYEAKPKWEGHRQPLVPLWGYENEADPKVVEKKIEAAVSHGVNVFIYDWYWYGGRPFLEDALDKGFLGAANNGKMKFFVMWANHHVNWLWDNKTADKRWENPRWSGWVDADEFRKISDRWISKYFSRPNYYRIGGKPVLMIYEVGTFVEGLGGAAKAAAALADFRARCEKAGLGGVHIMACDFGLTREMVKALGIDSATIYNMVHWSNPAGDPDYSTWAEKGARRFDSAREALGVPAYFAHASVGWDTNPRYPLSSVQPTVLGSTPEKFEAALRQAKYWCDRNTPDGMPKLITVNSWNEWTEGSYLEPDTHFKFGYLEAVKRVFGAAAVTKGILCLTFDDRNFGAWERCIPLFEKYGAHATFFVCGPIDARAESCMRKLSAAGHSIGLHGFKHQKTTDALARLGEEGYLREEILPQLSVCREKGLDVRSFAYPMSARTAETDALLLRHFARLRAGWGEVDGKSWGEKTPPFHVGESVSRPVVVAQCGTNPADMPERIAAMMPQIAASNLVLAVYAHDIEAKGRRHNLHNISEENLEKVLLAAKEAGVKVVGFDELPGGNISSTPFEKTHLAPFKKAQVNFTRQRIFPGFDGRLCKIQPSVATDGKGTALLGFQKLLLTGSDVFYGQFLSKSVDGGKTWSEPVEQTSLADRMENGLRAARYATVRYSRAHGKWFALGMKQLYENDKVPFQKYIDGRPYGTPIYVSVDVEKGCFTDSKALEFPFEYEMALPFGQMLECDDGDLLACFYYRPVGSQQKSRCVTVRYAFEEDGLRVVRAGTPIARDDLVRGVGEPSLAQIGDKVYMTLRSDEMGLWCVSDDGGMTFSKPRPWTWTDGKRIGNKNTQQHWMTCGGALFLAYTREDSANGHVFRNRAPIYMAQFDPVCGALVRKTEFPLVPELGARLGNFCVDFTGSESWLVTAEWMQPLGCEKYGSDNSIWLIRAK